MNSLTRHPYTIIKEHRKSLAIHISPNKEMLVKAPLLATEYDINDFLNRKSYWIAKQINFFSQFKNKKINPYESGSEFFYLGKQYLVIINKSLNTEYVKKDNYKLNIFSAKPKNKHHTYEVLHTWLYSKMEIEFTLSLKRCLKKFNNIPQPDIKIRKLSRRWGSYMHTHTVILNPLLIHAQKKCIDYVIMHELCHYFYKTHSTEFYSLLGSKIPNWKNLKKELELFYFNFEE